MGYCTPKNASLSLHAGGCRIQHASLIVGYCTPKNASLSVHVGGCRIQCASLIKGTTTRYKTKELAGIWEITDGDGLTLRQAELERRQGIVCYYVTMFMNDKTIIVSADMLLLLLLRFYHSLLLATVSPITHLGLQQKKMKTLHLKTN